MNDDFNYIKNKKGDIKSAFLKTNKADYERLKKLSKRVTYTIYFIPENTKVEFNDNGWLISAEGKARDIWQFVDGWAMPYECFVNGFPFPVKMEEMWNSDREVVEVDIEELRWNLKYPWWNSDEDIPYNLTPQEVLEDMNRYEDHKERIENVEVEYPLLLIQTKQDRWLIYDGVHRFVKQVLDKKKKVLCKKFRIEEMDEYINEEDEDRFKEWKTLE